MSMKLKNFLCHDCHLSGPFTSCAHINKYCLTCTEKSKSANLDPNVEEATEKVNDKSLKLFRKSKKKKPRTKRKSETGGIKRSQIRVLSAKGMHKRK